MSQRSVLVPIREAMLTIVPAVALVVGGFWLAWSFVPPPLPKKLVIGAATPGSPYHEAALRYAEFFKGTGVTLEVRETRGSLDNLAQLKDVNSGLDAAFVQGGLAKSDDSAALVSLGRISYEPVWIFQRAGTPLTRLTELKGKRVLIGPQGSGTEAVALRLLGASGITRETATLINAELPTYPETFEADKADAGLLVLAPDARTVKRLFASPHARIVSLAQADAYAQRFPFFSRIELKQGVVDFANDLPAGDTQMLSTTAAVVMRRDLHPDRHMLHKRGLSRRQRPDLPGGHVQMPTGSEPVPGGLRHDTDVPGAASALQRGNVLFWPMRVWRLPARRSGDAMRSHRLLRTWSRLRGLHLPVYVVLT